jgi:hypothetical protein
MCTKMMYKYDSKGVRFIRGHRQAERKLGMSDASGLALCATIGIGIESNGINGADSSFRLLT